MKVVKTFWFNSLTGAIGIVVGKDEVTGKPKAYIGSVSGLDREADEKQVRELGGKVSVAVLEEILGLLKKKS